MGRTMQTCWRREAWGVNRVNGRATSLNPERPDRTGSTIRRRYSGAYGG